MNTANSLLLLGLFTGFLFFYRLADRDLWSSHEGRAAQDAQSMLTAGSWGLPRLFDGHTELQKPPLYYWLVAGLARLKGAPVDAWAVRLPAALSALGGVLLVYELGRRRGRRIAGLSAALILATAVHYITLARTGRIDMPLTLTVAIALAGFYLGHRRWREQQGRGAWWCLLPAYLAVAAGVLLKGPIGLVLPVAVAGVYLLLEGELPAPWRARRWASLSHRLGLWWGLPLAVGLAAPWFVWAGLQTHGSLLQTFFWHHNFERAFGGAGGQHHLRAHAWYLYGPYLATYFLPWSVLLPVAGWYFARHPDWRADPEARFGLVWLLSVTVVLSCVRFKRADYLVPAFPGAALFLGCACERWYAASLHRRRLAAALGLVVAACAAGWLVEITVNQPAEEPGREYRRFAAAIRRYVPQPGLVLFFRAEAHALAFHVGEPIDTFLEWENLDIWAGRPGCYYLVMPAECAAEWPAHVTSGRLEEVMRSTDFAGAGRRERPLVLMRTRPDVPPRPSG